MTRPLMCFLLAAVACQTKRPQPVDLEPIDTCAVCRMAVSEIRYAAEVIDAEERVLKFDDIGCMIRFLRERNREAQVLAQFVVDYDSRRWIEAERAHYVKSESIQSPMASGLIAFEDRSAADRYAARFEGRLLAWPDLRK